MFRSAEFLSPLTLLKQMLNKKQILIYQHCGDRLNISVGQKKENHVLNFLYNIMMGIYTTTQKNIEKPTENVHTRRNSYGIVIWSLLFVSCGFEWRLFMVSLHVMWF